MVRTAMSLGDALCVGVPVHPELAPSHDVELPSVNRTSHMQKRLQFHSVGTLSPGEFLISYLPAKFS